MKFALCNEVIADRPFEAQCAFAAELGYDGLEIAPFTLGDDPRALTEADIRPVKAALANAGIVATGLHWLLVKPAGLSITAADAAIRRTTRDVMVANVDLCAELGGTVLVHGSPAQRMLGGDAEAARGRATELFAEVAEVAQAAGVTYCLEPLRAVETDFVNTVSQAVQIVEAVASPNFRTMIDTSAAATMEAEPVADAIRRWMPTGHIAHIQFNDSNRRAAGQGEDRFRDVLAALAETGYDGTIAMEPFDTVPDGPAAAAFTLGYVRGLMEALA